MKDSRGFVWIGTRGGLCRFDGYDVKVFQYHPLDSTSLSDNSIIGSTKLIAEDNEGYLWIGTQKGLNRFDPVSERFTRYFYPSGTPDSTRKSYIGCLHTDRQGTLWVGNGNGLYQYQPESNHFRGYCPNDEDILSLENYVTAICEESPNKLWVGTYSGLFLFDKVTEVFDPIRYIPVSQHDPENINIITIAHDIDSTLLVGTRQGFLAYNKKSSTLVPSYPFFDDKARISWLDIAVDPVDGKNTLWITYGKLFRYNKNTGSRTYLLPDPDDPASILGQVIYSIYFDDMGLMWVAGTRGVNMMDPEMNQMEIHPDFVSLYGKNASVFLRDGRNHFWIATAHSKLIHFDQGMNLVKEYNSVPVDLETEHPSFDTRVLFEDSQGNIWMGTSNKGLFCIENGKDELVRCHLKGFRPDFKSFDIFDVYEDSEGTLWVCTNAGLFARKAEDPLTGFQWFEQDGLLDTGAVCCAFEDRSGWFWISTYNQGLFCRTAESSESNRFIHYSYEPGNPQSPGSEPVWSIVEDIHGELWFATENGLYHFKREENIFEPYFSQTEKGANCIWDMQGDNKGYLWMTTEAGLIRCKPKAVGSAEKGTVDIKKILPFREIFMKNIDKTSDGYMYVGGADYTDNGYFRLHPDSIKENTHAPKVYVTEFLVRNESFVLDTSIILKKHITLRYHQNFFSFKFAALDYTYPEKNQYAYFLEGLEDDWIYIGNRRLANYTDVPPGHYIFRVKGSNNDGYWNEEGASVRISILPPPWQTWWAYSFYGLFLLGLILAWRKYDLKRLRLKHALELEHVEAKKLKELDGMKSRFFANISHEFRTPLTLILGPMQNLFQKVSDESGKQDLNIMQRSALRLQRLINQLLELSRLESGKLELHPDEENIVALVKNYVQQFESLAKHKGITLEFCSESDDIPAVVDRDKIEVILFNLLGNAFKFTNKGGKISLGLSGKREAGGGKQDIKEPPPAFRLLPPDESYVEITISDTGVGIPQEKLPRIFDRFYQVNDSYTKDGEGTGIGLALSKELVELHGGTITTESVVGQGSTFRVFLPLGIGQLKSKSKEQKSKIKDDFDIDNRQPTIDNHEPATRNAKPETRNAEPLVLIVEDNPDLRLYIRGILGQDYRILEAGSGRQGLAKALEHIPDLVLTDVMMPEMDGYELSRKLKTDERTSHIPVILLTARASVESKLEGLETGADDFISKPFDTDELMVRIKNLILQRKILQGRFLKNAEIIGLNRLMGLPDNGITSVDQQFLRKAIRMVEQHLNDDKFTVEQFTEAMAVSQMQLYRKLKALVNLSTSEFIRFVRLNNAAMLLRQQAGNIAEIAYAVGFNNPSYFAECFKKQFGQTPSEFADPKKSKSQADYTL